MNNQTISDIYAANNKIRERLIAMVSDIPDEHSKFLHDGETWTLAEFVEHIAIVQDGMTKISAKLLTQAQKAQKASDGTAKLSESFTQKAAQMRDMKLEAPDRVRPTGTKSVAESLEKMRETREELEKLRPLFERFDATDFKFPHPFMGDLTAHEWLALIGGHEARHLRQIENLLQKVGDSAR